MICRELIAKMEQDFPPEYALEWDNTGLLAGRLGKTIKNIYIALDATDEVIEEAIEQKADLLITHHPLIISPLKKVTDEEFIPRRLVQMIQNDISYYAMHTNYDVLRMGELAGQKLGFQNPAVLNTTCSEEGRERGIGEVAELAKAMTLERYCEHVKKSFALDTVRVFGDPGKEVKRVAVSPGSGKHMTEAALSKKADVLITGDIGHHEGIDAAARDMAIIDAGHYGMEYIFIEDIKMYIERKFPNMRVTTAEVHHPFRVV